MRRCEIQDFPGYHIYEDGRVWSDSKGTNTLHGRFLAQPLDKDGYVCYILYCDKRRHNRKAHRLVLEAFVGPRPEGMECRHLSGNPQNNSVDNLCWGTPVENQGDRKIHGTNSIGEGHGSSKLTSIEVMEIRDLLAGGLFTQQEIGDMYGIMQAQVSMIKLGKTWKCILENDNG